jgi:DNA-binding response OmpR family regulator
MQQLILIIDDDESLSEAMAETLEDIGYRVVCSKNSKEGLIVAHQQPPDLILCDVVLPDAAGFETVSDLRKHADTSRVPVVLMTGHPDSAKYQGEGKCMLLMKPFSLQTLVDVVKGTLAAQHPVSK